MLDDDLAVLGQVLGDVHRAARASAAAAAAEAAAVERARAAGVSWRVIAEAHGGLTSNGLRLRYGGPAVRSAAGRVPVARGA